MRFTCLDVYCAVLSNFLNKRQIALNLFHLTGTDIKPNDKVLERDLRHLEEIGYIQRTITPRGEKLYGLSDNLEKARKRYELKKAS